MKNSKRIDFRLSEKEVENMVSNMRARGFKSKSDYIRYLIREDNPFIKPLRDEFISLRAELRNLTEKNQESEFKQSKLSFLNYQAMGLLLGYFADMEPSEIAIEKTKVFLNKQERQFNEAWKRMRRK